MARLAVAAAPSPTLYARVDLVRDDAGLPRLMELEVIEPALFLASEPTASRRFAEAIVRRLDSPGRDGRGRQGARP